MSGWTVFLDRDGTLVDELGYGGDPARLRLLPGAAAAVAELNERGIAAVLVTNQSGVARGYFTEDDVDRCMERLQDLLSAAGGHLDRMYYCPHHPCEGLGSYTRECRCRKPDIGMLERAAADLEIDLKRSFVVGDSYRDIDMAVRAGARPVLVMTGHGSQAAVQVEANKLAVDYKARSVVEAVEWIVSLVKGNTT